MPETRVILVADDEAIICNFVRTALEAAGYTVMVAESGEQALELSRCFAGTIHALVSDVRMPKVDGFALREQIVVERPGIKVLLMSGQATIPHGVPFLRKPFKAETLTESVRRLFVQSTAA